MRLSRDLLAEAFPDNPRLRAELEEMARFLDDASAQVAELLASADDASTRLASLESEGTQAHNPLLDAISNLPDEPGALELLGGDQAGIRGIDSADDACLVSRALLISYAGKGATASRPALSAYRRAIYFDTTLHANGRPIFWTGTAWVGHDGVAV